MPSSHGLIIPLSSPCSIISSLNTRVPEVPMNSLAFVCFVSSTLIPFWAFFWKPKASKKNSSNLDLSPIEVHPIFLLFFDSYILIFINKFNI